MPHFGWFQLERFQWSFNSEWGWNSFHFWQRPPTKSTWKAGLPALRHLGSCQRHHRKELCGMVPIYAESMQVTRTAIGPSVPLFLDENVRCGTCSLLITRFSGCTADGLQVVWNSVSGHGKTQFKRKSSFEALVAALQARPENDWCLQIRFTVLRNNLEKFP